jgi:hypothetical protein
LCIDSRLNVEDIDDDARNFYKEAVSKIKEHLGDEQAASTLVIENCPQRTALLKVVKDNQLTRL